MFAKYRYLQWVIILFLVGVSNGFAGGWEQISELPTWRRGMTAAAVNGYHLSLGRLVRQRSLFTNR